MTGVTELFVFTARCYAERGIARQIQFVHPSSLPVCSFVTLRYRGHIGWNTSQVLLWLFNIGFILSADPTIMDLLQTKHPEILPEMGRGR